MDIALRDGTPANRLVTDLKQYLKYPDKLFRRVRDEHGQLQLSKRAKEFHPGAGVYRSSYKNARRLAVTETNMEFPDKLAHITNLLYLCIVKVKQG